MSSEVEVSQIGRVQILRLTRPEKKNAITEAMYAKLSQAIEHGEQSDDIACHVILGSNGIFSAGNDISDFLATAKSASGLGRNVTRFIMLLPEIKKPLLAGVDGKAVGIGATLLLHCDLVFATPRAEFSTPFIDLGLVPEAGSSLLMPRVLGHQRAFEMLVLGTVFSAERARESGLVNAIVAPDQLEAAVLDAAARLAAKPPEALAMARRLLKGDSGDVAVRMREEAALFQGRLASAEAMESFKAFFEKRPPDFRTQRG